MSGSSLRNRGSVRKGRHASTTPDLALARHLIGYAARKAPPNLAERLEEEWLADLMARRSAFSRIRFGVGCCWATRVIAREFGAAAVAAASSAAGERLLVGYGGHDLSRVSRRTVALIAIGCLHVGIFYLYLSGFSGPLAVDRTDPLTTTKFISPTRRRHQSLPIQPNVTLTTLQPLPTPIPTIDFPPQTTTIDVIRSPRPNFEPVPRQVPEPVRRVLGGPGAGFPDTEDFYPADARRMNEQGATVVNVCVDPRGRLTAVPTVAESSGIRLLDEGALKLASAGSGHYRPTAENGLPVSACYAFRISFRLRDQF